MSDKNMFLGDSAYPHTPKTFPTELIDQLRFCANALETEYGYNIFSIAIAKSIDRIEQLERELAESKKGHARYEYMRKLTPNSFKCLWLENLDGKARFDDLVDAAIKEGEA
jgi:hypothetical protein